MDDRSPGKTSHYLCDLCALCGNSKAFTMVEVLVAILITSIVAGVIYGSYMGALKIIYASQKDMERTTMARLMLDRVTGDLACAFLRAGKEYLVFVGADGGEEGRGSDTVTFITTAHERRSRDVAESELSEVTYSLDASDGMGYLMRREDPTLDEDAFSGGETRAIGEGLAGLDFEYLGDGGWVPSWDSREDDSLPRAARVTLTMATEEEGGGKEGGEAVRYTAFRTEVAMPLGGSWEEKEEPTPTPLAGGRALPTPRPQ
ncbi:MAG: type II secretion system protein GspJ [Chlamydiota bacterium]